MSATTRRHPGGDGRDRGDGHEAAVHEASAQEGSDHPVDPRAVRVAIAPSMAHLDLPPLVVGPPPIPVQPTPSVVGRGILGGTAEPAIEPTVSSSTSVDAGSFVPFLVDDVAVEVALVPLGPARATLQARPAPAVSPGDARDATRATPPTAGAMNHATPALDADPGPPALGDLPPTRVLLEPLEPAADGRGALRREVVIDGWRIELELESERRAALRDRARRGREEAGHGGPTEVHAIIPGRIVSVSVAAGEAVVASQQLLVVEAMKMQNELRAPRDGVISRVAVAPGETIEIGDLLLVLE